MFWKLEKNFDRCLRAGARRINFLRLLTFLSAVILINYPFMKILFSLRDLSQHFKLLSLSNSSQKFFF